MEGQDGREWTGEERGTGGGRRRKGEGIEGYPLRMQILTTTLSFNTNTSKHVDHPK